MSNNKKYKYTPKTCPKHNFVWDRVSPPWEQDYICTECGETSTPGSDYRMGFDYKR